jgi:hypothetical protein
MSSDQPALLTDLAAKPIKENKAPKLSSKPKTPKPLLGEVTAIVLDLDAASPQQGLTFTITPKTGPARVVTLEATGEARQSAIAMLVAAKFSGKKMTVTLGEGNVARQLAFKPKARKKS